MNISATKKGFAAENKFAKKPRQITSKGYTDAMKNETVTQTLLRRLDASAGMHQRIAKECGISQATISRIYLRKCSPRLEFADLLLAWFDKNDTAKPSAQRIPNARRRVKAGGSDATAALSQ